MLVLCFGAPLWKFALGVKGNAAYRCMHSTKLDQADFSSASPLLFVFRISSRFFHLLLPSVFTLEPYFPTRASGFLPSYFIPRIPLKFPFSSTSGCSLFLADDIWALKQLVFTTFALFILLEWEKLLKHQESEKENFARKFTDGNVTQAINSKEECNSNG